MSAGRATGVLMFRFWTGATAGLLVGSFGFSSVSAEGLGSSATRISNSPSRSAYLFADANFSSQNSAANLWDRASGMALSKSGDSAASSQTFMFVDFAPPSPFSAGWSPMSAVVDAVPVRTSPLTESRTSVDTYFGVFESLSKQGMNGMPSGGDSTARTMR